MTLQLKHTTYFIKEQPFASSAKHNPNIIRLRKCWCVIGWVSGDKNLASMNRMTESLTASGVEKQKDIDFYTWAKKKSGKREEKREDERQGRLT